MTYYTNMTPAASLSPPVPTGGQGLTRRPSKLSPSDRLYRPLPSQTLAPPPVMPSNDMSNAHHGHPGNSTSHSAGVRPLRPASSAAPPIGKHSESPLPSLPEHISPALPLPQILIPSGSKPHARPSDHQPPEIPPILRPRGEIISPTHAYSQTPPVAQRYEASAPLPLPVEPYHARSSSPAFEYGTTDPRANYYPLTTSPVPLAIPYYLPSTSPTSPQTYGPNFAGSGPPSFPVPVVPLQQNVALGPPPFSYRPSDRNDYSDPYLQARYQTPLPLPPGSTHSHTAPAPLQSNHDNTLTDAPVVKKEETMRPKTQEEIDRQLALQLDRELNLGS